MTIDNEDLDVFFDTDAFADTATYLPFQGASASVTVIFDPEFLGIDFQTNQVDAADANLLIRESEVPNLKQRDRFYVRATYYEVIGFSLNSTGILNVLLAKVEI